MGANLTGTCSPVSMVCSIPSTLPICGHITSSNSRSSYCNCSVCSSLRLGLDKAILLAIASASSSSAITTLNMWASGLCHTLSLLIWATKDFECLESTANSYTTGPYHLIGTIPELPLYVRCSNQNHSPYTNLPCLSYPFFICSLAFLSLPTTSPSTFSSPSTFLGSSKSGTIACLF